MIAMTANVLYIINEFPGSFTAGSRVQPSEDYAKDSVSQEKDREFGKLHLIYPHNRKIF